MGDSDIPHGRRGRRWNSVSVKKRLRGGGGGIASDKVQRRLGDISWSIKNGGFYIN